MHLKVLCLSKWDRPSGQHFLLLTGFRALPFTSPNCYSPLAMQTKGTAARSSETESILQGMISFNVFAYGEKTKITCPIIL